MDYFPAARRVITNTKYLVLISHPFCNGPIPFPPWFLLNDSNRSSYDRSYLYLYKLHRDIEFTNECNSFNPLNKITKKQVT